MTTYSVRIVSPTARVDSVIEFEEWEHADLIDLIEGAERRARARAREQQYEEVRRRANEEAERLKHAIDNLNSFFADTSWGRSTTKQPTPDTPREPARPSTPHTEADARRVLQHYTGGVPAVTLRTLVRRAKRATHPDTGGTPADFHLVTAAEDILRRARRI